MEKALRMHLNTLGKITSAPVFCPWFSAFVRNAFAINMSALRPSKTINKLSRFNSTERGFFLKLVFPSKCRVFVYKLSEGKNTKNKNKDMSKVVFPQDTLSFNALLPSTNSFMTELKPTYQIILNITFFYCLCQTFPAFLFNIHHPLRNKYHLLTTWPFQMVGRGQNKGHNWKKYIYRKYIFTCFDG